jgi:tRNA pseudouridine38-40 synthase
VRKVHAATWAEIEPGIVEYRVEASSFCHQMVRSMVSVGVDVGRGKVEAAEVPAMLAALDRNASRGAAPPHGLTLVKVSYT